MTAGGIYFVGVLIDVALGQLVKMKDGITQIPFFS